MVSSQIPFPSTPNCQDSKLLITYTSWVRLPSNDTVGMETCVTTTVLLRAFLWPLESSIQLDIQLDKNPTSQYASRRRTISFRLCLTEIAGLIHTTGENLRFSNPIMRSFLFPRLEMTCVFCEFDLSRRTPGSPCQCTAFGLSLCTCSSPCLCSTWTNLTQVWRWWHEQPIGHNSHVADVWWHEPIGHNGHVADVTEVIWCMRSVPDTIHCIRASPERVIRIFENRPKSRFFVGQCHVQSHFWARKPGTRERRASSYKTFRRAWSRGRVRFFTARLC